MASSCVLRSSLGCNLRRSLGLKLRRGAHGSALHAAAEWRCSPWWVRQSRSTASSAAALVTEHIRKPHVDDRAYRAVKLANGLQVLLASDPNADTAAAALVVRAGMFQDPDSRPGLAHFHEHMLFLGTEKYPKEDEYNRFLGERGGDANAYTMGEYTTFYFKVAAPHLQGALDRFSQFFVAPLFNPSCLEREMHAVDSESSNYSMDDGWRALQVMKTTVADGHPFSRFEIGNLETLGKGDTAQLRNELLQWNRLHYRASAMRLAVVGSEELDELQRVVEESFGPVPGNDGQAAISYASVPWPEERLGRKISCVPVKDVRTISASWPLPPPSRHLFAKPEMYLGHVLGHEGSGSLHHALSQRGWVDQLTAGISQAFSDAQLFSLNVVLTPEGEANRESVLAMMLNYVALVREAGPQESTFREISALQEIAFAHKEDPAAPDDFVVASATALHHYAPEEALHGPFAVDEWKPNVIEEYLGLLRPERCLLFLTSPGFVGEAADDLPPGWKRERWYGAAFRDEPIVVGPDVDLAGAGAEELSLPSPNRFIPTGFALCGNGGQDEDVAAAGCPSRLPVEVSPPALLTASPLCRLWHKTDRAFGSPRGYVLASAHTPAYAAGPEAVAALRLFCGLVQDDLNAFAYDASVAGLTYNLEFTHSLGLSVGGFSDKLHELLREVVQRMTSVLADMETSSVSVDAGEVNAAGAAERALVLAEKLETQRQLLLQDYRNLVLEEPWSVASYYLSQIMVRGMWHVSEYEEALEHPPALPDLAAKVRSALSCLNMDMLTHGNLTVKQSMESAEMVVGAFELLGAQGAAEIPRLEVTRLPAGMPTVFEYDLTAENPSQENSCTLNLYQIGPLGDDARRDACAMLVCHIAGNSMYQRLRTEEQLGYVVQAGMWSEFHVCGLSTLVQGNQLHPSDVDKRVESWLEAFGLELESMPQEEFSNYVGAVVSGHVERYAQLSQETLRHWSEIQTRMYRFSRLSENVAALRSLRKADLVEFFREFITAEAPQRRKVSVRVLGTSAGGAHGASEGAILLNTWQDVRKFQQGGVGFLAPSPSELPLPLTAFPATGTRAMAAAQ